MERMLKLPIEDDKDLLVEYGRVFAWINSIEMMLQQLICFKGNLHLIDKTLKEKLLGRKTLGQKIEIAIGLIDPELITELRLLNEKRVLLAHNATAQELYLSDKEQKKGNHVIGIGEKQQILTVNFLHEITELAQSLSVKLHGAFLKGTKFAEKTL